MVGKIKDELYFFEANKAWSVKKEKKVKMKLHFVNIVSIIFQ